MKTSVEQFPYPAVEPDVVDTFASRLMWMPFIVIAAIALVVIITVILYFLKRGDGTGGLTGEGTVLVVFAYLMVTGFFTLMLNLSVVNDQQLESIEASINERKLVITSIEENYGVDVVEWGKSSGSLRSITVRTDSALMKCTQQVTSENMYSVFCGEGTVQTPLEDVVVP